MVVCTAITVLTAVTSRGLVEERNTSVFRLDRGIWVQQYCRLPHCMLTAKFYLNMTAYLSTKLHCVTPQNGPNNSGRCHTGTLLSAIEAVIGFSLGEGLYRCISHYTAISYFVQTRPAVLHDAQQTIRLNNRMSDCRRWSFEIHLYQQSIGLLNFVTLIWLNK